MNKKAKVLRAVGYNSKEDLEEIERREVCSELVKLKEENKCQYYLNN